MKNVQLLATLQSIDSALDADRRQFAANKEAMNPSPELKQLAAQIRSRFEEEKAAWVERRNKLEKEQEALVAHARQLKARRETVVAHIDPDELAWYEKKRQKLGVVVVPLQGRTCGGCGASLPTSVIQRVQAGDKVTCPVCGRLLVH